jgi:uncharacterized phiE125 gp8 family phage protein
VPLKLVTFPSEEPVSLHEVRAHLRLESGEDEYLADLIAIARRHCEAFQARAYITQTWDLYLNSFSCGCIAVPLPPMQEIVFIKYRDRAGIFQTLDLSEYVGDAFSEPGLICPAYGKSWPMTYSEINSVQIRFRAGYGTAADVPQEVKHAILLKVADLYEHRGGDEGIDKNINEAIESLLWPDRIGILG